MPWGRRLPVEEQQFLEDWLRRELHPVVPDHGFLAGTEEHLRDPRAVQLAQDAWPRAYQHTLLLLASLSGTLLLLAGLVMWLFWRQQKKNQG